LDSKALSALEQIHPEAANEILDDLERKGQSVHNPSAFVTVAASKVQLTAGSQWQASQDHSQTEAKVSTSWSMLTRADAAATSSSARGLLDSKAQAALDSLPQEVANEILDDLGKKGDMVMNPSAFVMSAANKRLSSGLAQGNSLGSGGAMSIAEMQERWYSATSQIDSQAMEALAMIGMEEAGTILQNLESMIESGKVTNPSAYVTKAARNVQIGQELKRGASPVSVPLGGQIGPPATPVKEMVSIPEDLDQQARDALERLSPLEQTSILESLSQLEAEGKVRNASAFVTTAARNVQSGKARPGATSSKVPSDALRHAIDAWRSTLDAKAFEGLQSLGHQDAEELLHKLETTDVRNPSAFVTTAVRDVRRKAGWEQQFSQPEPISLPLMASRSSYPVRAPMPSMGRGYRAGLDAQAQAALDQIPPEAAHNILADLEMKGHSVHNPSAFVTAAASKIQMAPVAASYGQAVSHGGVGGLSAAWAQWRNVLDSDAVDALESLDPQEQLSMLQELTSKAQQLRNPSAYVSRGVQHLRQGGSVTKRPRL